MSALTLRLRFVVLAALVAAGTAGCGSDSGAGSEPERVLPSAAERPAGSPPVSIVRRQAEGREPEPAPLTSAMTPGTAVLAPGPFNDRVRVQQLKLREGRAPRVTGTILNVADVSHTLVLVLQADFYDSDGRPVGSGVQEFSEVREFHDKPLRIDVPLGAVGDSVAGDPEKRPKAGSPPQPRGSEVASARLLVTELVNE